MKRLLAPFLSLALAAAPILAQEARVVERLEDLPPHLYPVEGSLTDLLDDDEALRELADRARTDLLQDVERCEFGSVAARQEMLEALLQLDLILGRDEEALGVLREMRALDDEEAERLILALPAEAWLRARREVGRDAPAEELKDAYADALRGLVMLLPPDVVRKPLARRRAQTAFLGEGVLAMAAARLDAGVAEAGGVDLSTLERLAAFANGRRILLPVKEETLLIYDAYLSATEPRESIWSAREVTLSPDEPARTVVVGIWDTGVDVSTLEGRVWRNPGERPDGRDSDGNGYVDDLHGIAFAPDFEAVPELLQPHDMPDGTLREAVACLPLLDDMAAGGGSPAAHALRRRVESMDASAAERFLERLRFAGLYTHGTHVAGIAVAGNPFARVLVVRLGLTADELDVVKDEPWARGFIATCARSVAYFRDHGVRVVNMSWGWTVDELAENLALHGIGRDTADRMARARATHAILSRGLRTALASAPEILFVSGAGNTGEAVERERWIPQTFDLPNLLVVGAVDEAGDLTAFTSFGDFVDFYANGERVESSVPGGARLRLSGTSMAAPQATNLAAKLLAREPDLTPEELIARMVATSETVERDGRPIRLLHPAAALAARGG